VLLGAVFPQTEIGADPGGVRAYLQAVQDLGFAHLLVYDHVTGADAAVYPDLPGPYRAEHPFHELFVLLGFAAAVAPGLELVPKVLILPQRQAVLVAKQAAEVDRLAGGRFRLGVGIGWNAAEYETMGAGFKNRARRFEEQIHLLRRLWQEPMVTFEGELHSVRAAGINPLPIQRPIPLWIGGAAEPALKRAAELADGFFPQRSPDGDWAITLERMRAWRRAAGGDPAAFGIETRINAGGGKPEGWRQVAEEWRTLGATHLGINTMSGGLHGADAHIAQLQEVRDAIADLCG
jgi:probable F420-dependent oxidoreductase